MHPNFSTTAYVKERIPATPSKSNRPIVMLAFYNKGEHWENTAPIEKRIIESLIHFKIIGAASLPVNQCLYDQDDRINQQTFMRVAKFDIFSTVTSVWKSSKGLSLWRVVYNNKYEHTWMKMRSWKLEISIN